MNNQNTNPARMLLRLTAGLVASFLGTLPVLSQIFDSGSDGSYGDLIVTNDTTLALPPDGVFKCKTIYVTNGAHLFFEHNSANTPVFLLSKGDVTINCE